MDLDGVTFVLVIFLSGLLAFVMLNPGGYVQLGRNAIEECERDLPRHEYCKIIAIREGEEDG